MHFRGKLSVSDHPYVKYFQNFIRNAHIILWNHYDDSSNLEDFFKAKCSKDLARICFEGDIPLKPFFKKLKPFLRNVEVVDFRDRRDYSSDEAKFLKYCPNLTKLILGDGISRPNSKAIMAQKYRKLTDFYYMDSFVEDLDTDKVRAFFETNPTINTVAWKFRYDDRSLYVRYAVVCLKTVDYVPNLAHLSLQICRFLADSFDEISTYLGLLCERENFHCLEIEFIGKKGANALKTHANKMAEWKQFTKMLLYSMNFTKLIPAIRSLIYLRNIVLCDVTTTLNWTWCNDNDLIALVDRKKNLYLPFIEEVKLIDMDQEVAEVFIMLFTRHWIKLNKILLPKSSFGEVELDVSLLNRERRKLKDACEVTIFTDHADNPTNLKHDLIKLKRAEFIELGAKDAAAFETYYMIP